MTPLKRLISFRAFENKHFWQIVYEWEDEISKTLDIPIETHTFKFHRLKRFLCYHGIPLWGSGTSLQFEMGPHTINRRALRRNAIPWIIDYFLSPEETDSFISTLHIAPLTLISSREAYELVKSRLKDSSIKVRHLGLSLPDRWMPKAESEWDGKDYDLILMGRLSKGFTEYLDRYISFHPNIKVARRQLHDGYRKVFSVDDPSVLVGKVDTRDEYMALLKRSRAFIYTTPGIDGDRKSTNGLSQVTPRFLEALACGCNVVLRYPDNADTRWYELQKFGPSIQSYEEFDRALTEAINTRPDYEKVVAYLNRHTTSTRARELKELIDSL